jgi:hypothetical protein
LEIWRVGDVVKRFARNSDDVRQPIRQFRATVCWSRRSGLKIAILAVSALFAADQIQHTYLPKLPKIANFILCQPGEQK